MKQPNVFVLIKPRRMNKLLFIVLLLLSYSVIFSQSDKIEIEGAITISNSESDSPLAGTIRWTGTDFEGYNGTDWVSLTCCGDQDDPLMYDGFPPVTDGVSQYVLSGNKWQSNNLTYSFTNSTSDLDVSIQRQVIVEAFNKWADVSTLNFSEVQSGGDFKIEFATGNHGDGNPFDGSGRTLAHAFFPPPNGSLAGDCHFDDDENWSVNGTGIDLLSVALHEIGHALGLEHSADSRAVMYAFYNGSNQVLREDDILGIQTLYPPPNLPGWFVSYSGSNAYQQINASSVGLGDIGFGDFLGDGGEDVFVSLGGRWIFSNNGSSTWTNLGNSNVPTSGLRFGDFDGDGKTDVFTSDGTTWRYSSGGAQGWVNLGNSSTPLRDLRFGDFDGDGRTDVFSTNGTTWSYSSGGAQAWAPLGNATTPVENMLFADLNGDGFTDIFTISN